MSYQDFSQVSETLLIQIKSFFINPKIAKAMLCLSILVFVLSTYHLVSLYVSYNDWVTIDVNLLRNEIAMPGQNLPSINKKHLFGKVVKPGGTLSDARKTTLPIKLKGLIYDINPKFGAAMILGPDGLEKSYHVGDKLPIKGSNITLEFIFKDKVFIKNEDILEFMEYPKLELKNGSDGHSGGRGSSSNQFLPAIENTDPINTEIEPEHNNPNNNVEDLDTNAAVDKLSREQGSRLKLEKFRKKGKINFN